MHRVFGGMLLAAVLAWGAPAQGQPGAGPGEAVVLVTIDGLRWQEAFAGADPTLVTDPAYRARFVDVPDRAAALTPFLQRMRTEGAAIGDRAAGSCARVANGHWFSYPGYAEMMGGQPHPVINHNAKVTNREPTALGWLKAQSADVAVFAEWDTMPFILDAEGTGIAVTTPARPQDPHDPQVMAAALPEGGAPWLTARWPVVWVALGDTDNRAHAGDYHGYLAAAAEADAFVAWLWAGLEARAAAGRGRATLLVTVDHGRGASAGGAWRGHGSGQWRGMTVPGLRREGSDAVFMLAMGPRVTAARLGRYTDGACATLAQIAATVITAAGRDPQAFRPDAAPPLDIFRD